MKPEASGFCQDWAPGLGLGLGLGLRDGLRVGFGPTQDQGHILWVGNHRRREPRISGGNGK